MNNTRLRRCSVDGAKSDLNGYVETDPSGRYGRLREVLGKGAMKVVYRGFDEVLGMEVAWNQIKLNDAFRSSEELQRLYSEVHLLKNLHHDSIIRFYTSWIDVNRRNFNFITEMFTSGTLRGYRHKYQRVDIRAVKNWARQILLGLEYLHGHDPPVIHRDLKCDNIFVNGHLGQVKIGDLGLAAVLRGSQHAHSVIGTPEFMAPELYEEEYNELVDIYSFGMCVLEMLTSEYPYSECSNPAQIYKKVTSGKLPEAFYRIQDSEAQRFVGKCLENVSERLPARELLLDSFLACDDEQKLNMPIPRAQMKTLSLFNGVMEEEKDFMEPNLKRTANMTITGTMNPEDDTIFLKVQISDKDGNNARNIYFPFDIVNDTALDVATEMVKELEISDWEPSEIAEMIDEQISSLVPSWKEWGSPRFDQDLHQQISFIYEEKEDDDYDINNRPLYSSSCSSSHNSLLALNSSYFLRRNNLTSGDRNWIRDDPFMNDDASSVSSFNSFSYANVNYYSGNCEDDYDSNVKGGEPLPIGMAHKSTRFRPADIATTTNHCNLLTGCPRANWLEHHRQLKQQQQRRPPKLTRIRSLVDVRSQLLHRSLVEEINKRRLFKTVGAVENIGFQELDGEFSESKMFNTTCGFVGRSSS